MQQFNMKQKEEYKETELGLLPESWKVDNLENEYIEFKNGLWKGKKEPFVKVKVLRNTNFKNDGTIILNNIAELDVEEKQFKTREITKGDIILERSGGGPAQPVGRVVFFDIEERFNYSFSNFTSRIRVVNKEKIFPKYLFYSLLDFYMSGKTNDIQNRTTGIRNLDFSKYKQIFISLPLLPEQKKNANVLSIIQEAKEKTENLINSLKELKKSLIKHLFTYGPVSLEETEKVKLKDTEIGMVPEEWESTKLGYIFKEVNHKIKNIKINKNNIPVLSMTRYKGLILQKMKFGKRVASRDILNYKIIKKGQLAYGFPMDEGVIYFLKDYDLGAVSPAYLIWDLVNERIDKAYLDFLLKSPALIEKYKSLSSTTVHRRRIVNKNDFRNITIYFPSLSEQKQIVLILLILEESIEKEKNKKNALEELFKSMLHNLVTAKIRVNNLEI